MPGPRTGQSVRLRTCGVAVAHSSEAPRCALLRGNSQPRRRSAPATPRPARSRRSPLLLGPQDAAAEVRWPAQEEPQLDPAQRRKQRRTGSALLLAATSSCVPSTRRWGAQRASERRVRRGVQARCRVCPLAVGTKRRPGCHRRSNQRRHTKHRRQQPRSPTTQPSRKRARTRRCRASVHWAVRLAIGWTRPCRSGRRGRSAWRGGTSAGVPCADAAARGERPGEAQHEC